MLAPWLLPRRAEMKELDEIDRRHVEAAEGWLELGEWEEGKKELLSVNPVAMAHPEVLRVLLEFLTARSQWNAVAEGARLLCIVEPEGIHGWFFRAAALNRMERTTEARDILLSVVDRFPKAYPIHYALASYCCRLGNLVEARRWWKKAVKLARGNKLMEIASEDPDLQELWKSGFLQEDG